VFSSPCFLGFFCQGAQSLTLLACDVRLIAKEGAVLGASKKDAGGGEKEGMMEVEEVQS